MTKLPIVAGTDVETPVRADPRRREPIEEEMLEPIHELFECYKQARLKYDRAIAEVAMTSLARPQTPIGSWADPGTMSCTRSAPATR
jgi:hypothetical protein